MSDSIHIWVDSDACPVKDEIERLAERRGLGVSHVCAVQMRDRGGESVSVIEVPDGPDAADEWILANCRSGDIVITCDVPLAASAVKLGAFVLEHRGRELDTENIGGRVQMRDLVTSLREQGNMTSGPPPFTAADRRAFTNALGRMLDRLLKNRQAPGKIED